MVCSIPDGSQPVRVFVVSEIFNIANEPMKKGQPDKTSPDSFIGASKVISHAK
jgi:hypothetical protein